jgi:S-adenosylmethionine decarboxylase
LTPRRGLGLTSATLEAISTGAEWLVDAHGCDPARLRSTAALAGVFERVVAELGLHAPGEAQWRAFPGEGGVTGLLLLTESHLACHTFPERGFAAFNLYCCRPREPWPWRERLAEALGATRVEVRYVERGAA